MSKKKKRHYTDFGQLGKEHYGIDPPSKKQDHRHKGKLPKNTIIRDSFYEPSTECLKRKIFIEGAKELADRFNSEKMSQSSIRSLFNLLKSAEKNLRKSKCKYKETYHEFLTRCEYQWRRGVIPKIFLDFAKAHLELATESEHEFRGFLTYLTSIMARKIS